MISSSLESTRLAVHLLTSSSREESKAKPRPDLWLLSFQNNGHAGSVIVNGTSNGSSYENALKKLVLILKLKASDNLKQLEDLWDSINAPPSAPSPASNVVTSSKLAASKSPNSGSLSPRTTPSPPLSNSSCSNSSTIFDSSASSPTSSSSSPSPPRVSTNKLKQPPSPGKSTAAKVEPTNNLKRDASKLSTTSEQEAKKPKLNTTSSSSTAAKKVESSAPAKGAKNPTTTANKKDDKTTKTTVAKSTTAAAKNKPATKSSQANESKSAADAKSSSKENGSSSETSPKSSLKRDLAETERPAPERPSSFVLATVSVKEEEFNKLEEGKSIEITYDDSMIDVSTNSNALNHHHASSAGSTSPTSSSSNNNSQSASSNTGFLEGGSAANKRIKLDIDSTAASSGDLVSSDMGETTQVDLDDMLTGLSCSVCKKINQETNNKLIECRNCKYMYHQLCHKPPLSPDQLEEQYISKCFECINSATSDSESSSSVSALARDGSMDEPDALRNSSTSSNHSKDPSPAGLFTKRDSLTSETSLLSSPGSKQGQLVGGMKGLAALATKFNPSQSAQTAAPAAANKNNDLFNKFKQSASSTALAPVSNDPTKTKSPFITNGGQTAQQQKRNIFNIASSSSATNAIPVSAPASDKRAK